MVYESVAAQPSRTVRKRQARRDQIVTAARELVRAGGLDSLTVASLAEQLDYTPGALYRYFPSKDALIVELQRAALGEIAAALAAFTERFRGAAEAAELSERTRAIGELLAAGRFYAALPRALPDQLHLVQATLADPRPLVATDVAAGIMPMVQQVLSAVQASFRSAVECGALEPGDERARVVTFWAALQGVVQLDKLSRFDHRLFDVTRLAETLTWALLRGMGADPGELSAAGQVVAELSAE